MYRIVTVIVAQISQNARDIYTRYDVYYFQPSGLLRLHMQNLTHLFALIPTLLSVITLTGRRFLAHLHPAEHYTPIRNVLVECVFSCQGAWTN